MGDDLRDCWDLEQQVFFEGVDKASYDAVCKERDDYKYLLESINKHLDPGTCDSTDGMVRIIKERDEWKKIADWRGEDLDAVKMTDFDQLHSEILQLKIERNKLQAEAERLKGERAKYKTLDALLADNGEICELHGDIEALQAKLKLAVEALEKCEDGTLDAWQIGIVAADALKLIKGDGE